MTYKNVFVEINERQIGPPGGQMTVFQWYFQIITPLFSHKTKNACCQLFTGWFFVSQKAGVGLSGLINSHK